MQHAIDAFGMTDRGTVRRENEDAFAQLPEEGFFVLADGMGGASGGKIAASAAVDFLCRWRQRDRRLSLEASSSKEGAEALYEGIVAANQAIWEMSRTDKTLMGMGTTLCCLSFCHNYLVYGHVGDSRIYRLRDKDLEQLTQDDSLLAELMAVGVLETDEVESFPLKHILTKSLGCKPSVEPTVQTTFLKPGDLYLVCSDGLSSSLRNFELKRLLLAGKSLPDLAETLIEEAKRKGSSDNITVMLLQVRKNDGKKDLS